MSNLDIYTNFYVDNHENLMRSLKNTFETPHDGEDAVQEAFMRALTFLGSFDPERGSFEGWFRRILQNSIRDKRRDNILRGVCQVDQDLEDVDPHDKVYSDKSVRKAIKSSRNPLRSMLTMFFIDGYSVSQISESLGIKPTSVSQAIWRFKMKVKGEDTHE